MVGAVPLAPALGHGLNVVHALGCGAPSLLLTPAVSLAVGTISLLSTDRMHGKESLAVLTPLVVVATLLGCSSLPVLLCTVFGTPTLSHHRVRTSWRTGTGTSRGSRHQVFMPSNDSAFLFIAWSLALESHSQTTAPSLNRHPCASTHGGRLSMAENPCLYP